MSEPSPSLRAVLDALGALVEAGDLDPLTPWQIAVLADAFSVRGFSSASSLTLSRRPAAPRPSENPSRPRLDPGRLGGVPSP